MSKSTRRRSLALAGCVVSISLALVGCTSHPATSAGGSGTAAGPMGGTGLAAVDAAADRATAKIDFVEETLPNGLRVIYAPLTNAPVVHVRVLYHVGSRDENPERQGFAHMFEHMMFRGSQHVPPEQHMKLIGQFGGISNAFTSFDQTTYINTVPSSHTEMALWLEADRMASFKVSDEVFQTERKVVAEEWRLRTANPPTGTLPQDFARLAFQKHSYRWTPIGDMDQLRQASSSELQEFFNEYYVPNNACLIIAGDIDVARTSYWVRKYYGWIPEGADVVRSIPSEPEQTEERKLVVYRKTVPIPIIAMGYKTTDYRSADHAALDAAGAVLGRGRTSRLNRALVNPPAGGKPVALGVGAGNQQRQDLSLFSVSATALPGNDPDAVEKQVKDLVAEFVATGPTAEELERYKVQSRQAILRGRETAEEIATELGEAEVFGGNAADVNIELAKVEALTPELVRAAAAKYLRPERLTIVQYLPDPLGTKARADQSADASKADEAAKAGVVKSDKVVEPKPAPFPAGYRTTPPTADIAAAKYNTGVVGEVNGVKVITLQDGRLPIAGFSLVIRNGSDAEPEGKQGVAGLTAAMLRRGSTGFDNLALAQALEARGVSVDVGVGGDTTSITGSSTTAELDFAIEKAALVLSEPTFPEQEFMRLKNQSAQGLRQSLVNGQTVVSRELGAALWAGTPFGRNQTPENIQAITLDDVKTWYQATYSKKDAFVIFAGDVSPERALALAEKLTRGLKDVEPPKAVYNVPAAPASRRIILVDSPDAKQSNILVGFRGYPNTSEERFAGSVASQVLSSGIDSRMGRYLRAERGLTYGASGVFGTGRRNGQFVCSIDTNPATTGASVEGVFKVLETIRMNEITTEELSAAKSRSAGSAILQTQTIQQQATRRAETVLNGWPADYYEKLPQRIAAVTKADVQSVLKKYASPDNAVIVVVGPASTVKAQLDSFGTVEVVPMPLQRKAASAATDSK